MQKYSLKRTIALCAAVLPLLTAVDALAAMYKWVDADGNVQYSQHRPIGDEDVTTIKPPSKVDTGAAQKDLDGKKKKLGDLQEGRDKAAEDAKKEAGKTALYKSNCETSRAKFNNVQNARRIRAVDEEGNITRATEEERQRRIKAAQANIAKWCS